MEGSWSDAYDETVTYPGFYEGAYGGVGYGAGWDAAFAYLGDAYPDAPGTSTSLFSLASSGQAPRLGSAGGVAGEVTHAAAVRDWAVGSTEAPTTSGTWEGAPPGGDQDGPPVSVAATTDRQVQRQGQSPPAQAAGSAHATGTREGNQRSWRGVWSGVGHFFRDDAYYFQQNLDGYQATLDVAGAFPVIGEPADALNAVISVGRWDWTGAGLSAASMFPIYGDAVGKGGKLARYAAKYGAKAATAVHGVTKASDLRFATRYGQYVRRADNFKHALSREHVLAALAEKQGKTVKLKPDGTPYNQLGGDP